MEDISDIQSLGSELGYDRRGGSRCQITAPPCKETMRSSPLIFALKQSFKYCEKSCAWVLELRHCSEYAIGITKCSGLPSGDAKDVAQVFNEVRILSEKSKDLSRIIHHNLVQLHDTNHKVDIHFPMRWPMFSDEWIPYPGQALIVSWFDGKSRPQPNATVWTLQSYACVPFTTQAWHMHHGSTG